MKLKEIRWKLEGEAPKTIRFPYRRKWWRGYMAGRRLFEISYYDNTWYRLYDMTDGLFNTEKQNGIGYATLAEAKAAAQDKLKRFMVRCHS